VKTLSFPTGPAWHFAASDMCYATLSFRGCVFFNAD